MAMSNSAPGAAALLGVFVNLGLACVKLTAGAFGRSSALLADGIESAADAASSLVVWGGLRYAHQPADEEHPYGHGKAEALATLVVGLALFGAGALIAWESISGIGDVHEPPEVWTPAVLLGVIALKEWLFRRVMVEAESVESKALVADAWHHRSDAITSAAALVGVCLAIWGGPAFASADKWAALAACSVVFWNGWNVLAPALHDIMDRTVPVDRRAEIMATAATVDGVKLIEKCRIRQSGLFWHMDIHVQVDGHLSVAVGHDIGHRVKDLILAKHPKVKDVVVHVEPWVDGLKAE